MPGLQPAVKKLYFAFRPDVMGTGYIDTSFAASVANRRFYRQGLNWAIANVKVTLPFGVPPGTSSKTVKIQTAQDTWITCNAWKKSFALWMEMNKFAMAEAPSIRPKFFDYKVHLNEQMYNEAVTGEAANAAGGKPGIYYQTADQAGSTAVARGILSPRTGPSAADAFILGGEWDYCKFVIPKVDDTADTDTFTAWLHGQSSAAGKGIISGYAYSRSLVTSPEPQELDVPTSWLTQVMRQGTDQTEDILEDLEDDNDEVPYSHTYYPGGKDNYPIPQTVSFSEFLQAPGTNTTGQVLEFNTGPFNAQCGLIAIDADELSLEGTDHTVLVEVTLVPGANRGYLTQGMGDVQ